MLTASFARQLRLEISKNSVSACTISPSFRLGFALSRGIPHPDQLNRCRLGMQAIKLKKRRVKKPGDLVDNSSIVRLFCSSNFPIAAID